MVLHSFSMDVVISLHGFFCGFISHLRLELLTYNVNIDWYAGNELCE